MSLSQDIESRIQILDIVSRYVSLKKAGVNYKGLCPFHSEKTPSFVVSPTKNIAHCFSCGKGGGPLRFLMDIEKIDFREAIQILAKEAGVELKTQFSQEQYEKGKDIYKLYRLASEWYHKNLYKEGSRIALDYLTNRGLSQETIKKFELGYSSAPRELLYALRDAGFDPQFIIDSGLFVSDTRDKFFGRVIFPICNAMGHPVAFTGRVLTDALPKYLNSPASHIFDKSSILHGLHLAKQSISKSGEVFIVEGQMDTITLHQAGIENTVGISGTALTKDHIRILRRFARVIYLSLDSDSAGVKATFASIDNLLNEDIEIRVIQIPNGKDPDEFIKNGGDFLTLRASSLGVVDFYLQEGGREYDMNTLIGKKKLTERCLEVVANLRSQVEVDFYLQQISGELGVSMEALYSEYKKSKHTVLMRRKAEAKKDQSESVGQDGKFSFSLPDLIAGYIYRYQFLDLFSSIFRYTTPDLANGSDNGLLTRTLLGTLDPDDLETLRIIDLHLEEAHMDSNPDVVERTFRDLLRSLQLRIFEDKKQNHLSHIDPNSDEYMLIDKELRDKARELGFSK